MPDINVIGVAHDRAVAEQIVGNCRLAGFAQDDVSIIMIKREEAAALENVDDQTGEGAKEVAGGVAKGAVIGGGAGVLAGLATMAIPAVGPVIGSGILLALFGGSGAFVGALSGAFASEDVSSEVVERYGMALREGQAIICVTATDAEQARTAEEVLRTGGADNVNSYLEAESPLANEPGVKDVSE